MLRGIDENTVWLADPSLGNRTYSRAQFLSMWETRGDESEHADLRGKFLAVLPASASISSQLGFFSKAPRRQSAAAVQLLADRGIR